MADRIPLIVDSSTNQVKELPAGDSIILADNENLKVGTGSDASIFSDGTNGYMRGFAALQNKVGDHDYIAFADGGATSIYFDNAVKLATTATGISVTGNVIYSGGSLTVEAALGDGATVNWDVTANPVAKVTIAGNRTLALPLNPLGSGQYASLLVIQDGTGSRTLTWNAAYEFKDDTAPTLTTTASKGDLFTFRYNGAKWLEVGRNQNLSLS
jgi:hypothetical protein